MMEADVGFLPLAAHHAMASVGAQRLLSGLLSGAGSPETLLVLSEVRQIDIAVIVHVAEFEDLRVAAATGPAGPGHAIHEPFHVDKLGAREQVKENALAFQAVQSGQVNCDGIGGE